MHNWRDGLLRTIFALALIAMAPEALAATVCTKELCVTRGRDHGTG